MQLLEDGIEGHRFDFYVISAAPEEVVRSALQGIVAPDHVIGTGLGYCASSGEIALSDEMYSEGSLPGIRSWNARSPRR